MNRLAPLIVRAPVVHRGERARVWAIAAEPEASPWLSDHIKLFLTGWIGGLIFFGTLLA